jgi:hypothetical protein
VPDNTTRNGTAHGGSGLGEETGLALLGGTNRGLGGGRVGVLLVRLSVVLGRVGRGGRGASLA